MESASQELVQLLADTKKQLEHLRTLGVEGIRGCKPVSSIEERGQAALPDLSTPYLPTPSSLFGDLAPAAATLTPSAETFEQIHCEIGDCIRCPLHQERTHVVHTEGNRKARLMFVGEAPGADEDIQARPFVGRAGQLLTKIIEAIGMKREEVLIGNVNRCRPPGNRAPTTEEASTCKPFLLREIAIVQPAVIVVLGNTAMKNLLETREGITRREMLRVGGLSLLGLSLPVLLRNQATAATAAKVQSASFGRAKSCILLFMWGGPAHQDTWDLKPDAPAEIRGEFSPIATDVPGIQICEHMPRQAAMMDKLALVRGIRSVENDHFLSEVYTGLPRIVGKRPAFGSLVSRLSANETHLPTYVSLDEPTVEQFEFEKPYYAGQGHAPFLNSSSPRSSSSASTIPGIGRASVCKSYPQGLVESMWINAGRLSIRGVGNYFLVGFLRSRSVRSFWRPRCCSRTHRRISGSSLCAAKSRARRR